MQERYKQIIQSNIIEIQNYIDSNKPLLPSPIKENLERLTSFLVDFIRVLNTALRNDIDDSLTGGLLNYWGRIEVLIVNLRNLFSGRGGDPATIYEDMRNFVDLIYSYNTSPFPGFPPYINVSAYILSLDAEKVDTREIGNLVEDLKEKQEVTTQLINTLRVEASKLSASTFAGIFGKEAKKHSYSKIRIRSKILLWKNQYFGSAEKWLISLFLSVIGIIYTIINYQIEFASLIFDEEYFYLENILNAIQKISIVAALLFVARLSLKNYKINKALYTSNIHRKNVLNSFKLLYDSIPEEDPVSRSKLLEEVARSIYVLGSNPYISTGKEEKIDLNTIIEILKIAKS